MRNTNTADCSPRTIHTKSKSQRHQRNASLPCARKRRCEEKKTGKRESQPADTIAPPSSAKNCVKKGRFTLRSPPLSPQHFPPGWPMRACFRRTSNPAIYTGCSAAERAHRLLGCIFSLLLLRGEDRWTVLAGRIVYRRVIPRPGDYSAGGIKYYERVSIFGISPEEHCVSRCVRVCVMCVVAGFWGQIGDLVFDGMRVERDKGWCRLAGGEYWIRD